MKRIRFTKDYNATKGKHVIQEITEYPAGHEGDVADDVAAAAIEAGAAEEVAAPKSEGGGKGGKTA